MTHAKRQSRTSGQECSCPNVACRELSGVKTQYFLGRARRFLLAGSRSLRNVESMKRFFIFTLGWCFALALAAAEFVPTNPPEVVPLKNKNSPAHQALKKFQRGANLGNYLEAPKTQDWGQKYTEA